MFRQSKTSPLLISAIVLLIVVASNRGTATAAAAAAAIKKGHVRAAGERNSSRKLSKNSKGTTVMTRDGRDDYEAGYAAGLAAAQAVVAFGTSAVRAEGSGTEQVAVRAGDEPAEALYAEDADTNNNVGAELERGDFLLTNGAVVSCKWAVKRRPDRRCSVLTAEGYLVKDLCPEECRSVVVGVVSKVKKQLPTDPVIDAVNDSSTFDAKIEAKGENNTASSSEAAGLPKPHPLDIIRENVIDGGDGIDSDDDGGDDALTTGSGDDGFPDDL